MNIMSRLQYCREMENDGGLEENQSDCEISTYRQRSNSGCGQSRLFPTTLCQPIVKNQKKCKPYQNSQVTWFVVATVPGFEKGFISGDFGLND